MPIPLKIDDILAETRLEMQKKMLQTVTTTGVDLDSVYGQTLQHIKEQKGDRARLGMEALMWVSHAKRPLRIDELCHALAVNGEATDLDPQKVLLQDTVLESCLGLTFVDKKTSAVRPIHDTLQEYLSRPGILPGAHKILGETCLAFLNYDKIKGLTANEVGDIRHMPFLEYSSLFWAAHAKIELSDRAKSLALELLNQFENDRSFPLSFKNTFPFTLYSSDRITSLHCASYLGIDALVAALIEIKSCDINETDYLSNTPLMWAVIRGNHGAVKLLLTCNGVDIDKQDIIGQTALWWAAAYKDVEMVRLLTNGGADPNKANNKGQTPLMMASDRRNMQIVALLQPQAITMSDLD